MTDAYQYDEVFVDLLLFGGKVCAHCRRELPRTEEHYGHDRYTEDGLTSRCLDCKRTSDREYDRDRRHRTTKKEAQQ